MNPYSRAASILNKSRIREGFPAHSSTDLFGKCSKDTLITLYLNKLDSIVHVSKSLSQRRPIQNIVVANVSSDLEMCYVTQQISLSSILVCCVVSKMMHIKKYKKRKRMLIRAKCEKNAQ